MNNFKVVGMSETDNGLQFISVFDSVEKAVEHYAGEVDPKAWHKDVSGNLMAAISGRTYYVSSEPYYPDEAN